MQLDGSKMGAGAGAEAIAVASGTFFVLSSHVAVLSCAANSCDVLSVVLSVPSVEIRCCFC
jgi:hypothetical protein